MYVCMYGWMDVICMYVYMSVCLSVCMYVYEHTIGEYDWRMRLENRRGWSGLHACVCVSLCVSVHFKKTYYWPGAGTCTYVRTYIHTYVCMNA